MPTATNDHTIDAAPPTPELTQAARAFLAVALRTMPAPTAALFATYQRLAAHEDRFAATAVVNGRHEAAARAQACAEHAHLKDRRPCHRLSPILPSTSGRCRWT
jgi:hypothetical protein